MYYLRARDEHFAQLLTLQTKMAERAEEKRNAAAEFLGTIRGSPVVVKLASGIEYHGVLQAVDGFMNITLADTKEVYAGKQVADYGDIFLRGSLVTFIATV